MKHEETVLLESGLAGQALGISDERVRQLVKDGRLKARRTARGRLLFEPAEVERLRLERAEAAQKNQQKKGAR